MVLPSSNGHPHLWEIRQQNHPSGLGWKSVSGLPFSALRASKGETGDWFSTSAFGRFCCLRFPRGEDLYISAIQALLFVRVPTMHYILLTWTKVLLNSLMSAKFPSTSWFEVLDHFLIKAQIFVKKKSPKTQQKKVTWHWPWPAFNVRFLGY